MTKITLPTPLTCGWRTPVNETASNCGVLATLVGEPTPLSHVTHDQCEACCQSFPPSPTRLNPVVASVLYAALMREERIAPSLQTPLDRAGLTRSKGQTSRLISIAEKSLSTLDAIDVKQLPSRFTQLCCYLGDEHRFDDGSMVCHHVRHERTSPTHCARCQDWTVTPPLSRPLALDEIVPGSSSNGHVRYWAVGVTTSPRQNPTLQACLESLTRAGWSDIHLFLDGTVRVPPTFKHLTTTWREQPLGACPAWLLSLAELVATHPHADAYAMFQDDVLVHHGDSLREYLERVLWPNQQTGLVSLYNPGVSSSQGWQLLPTSWDWGTLAVIFSPSTLRAFLSDTVVLRRALPMEPGQHLPIPELLREWIHRRCMNVSVPYPSLVQHIGTASTIWSGATLDAHRRAPWFSSDLEHSRNKGESLSHFPEDVFICKPSDEELYRERVRNGYEQMRRSSVVVCGIGRNVRPFLPRTAARIERLGGLFGDYQVVIFENDSSDATGEFLVDWERANPRLDIMREQLGSKQYPQTRDLERASALAQYRNRYLDRIGEMYSQHPFVIVVDLDLIGGWSYDGIANTFGQRNWDFVGSYGLEQLSMPPQQKSMRIHYDRWAFRAPKDSAADHLLGDHRDSLQRGMPMLAVDSCFGGLGVYRSQCLIKNRYGGSDCEHVVLHQQLRASGFSRLFLNPSQIAFRSVIVY